MNEHEHEHEQARELLPWLANGTLEGAERERVERHVRECLPCRAELAEQRRLRALVREQPAVSLSPEAGFERLTRRIEGGRRRGAGSGVTAKRARLAAAAAFAVLAAGALVVAVLQRVPEPPDGAYATLSEEAGAASALVDVIFADGVSEADVREMLAAHDAEIVAGPSPRLGRYTLRIGDGKVREAALEAVLERLGADERVRFAGRAYGPAGSAPPAPAQAGDGEAAR